MNLPIRMIACALTSLLVLPPLAAAQQPTSEQQSAIRTACRADFMAHCRGVPAGGAAALACLKDNATKISPACQKALASLAAASTPVSASPVAGGGLPSDTAAWPHTVRGDTGIATVYQPQVISWPERRILNTRIAIGITPTGAKEAALGHGRGGVQDAERPCDPDRDPDRTGAQVVAFPDHGHCAGCADRRKDQDGARGYRRQARPAGHGPAESATRAQTPPSEVALNNAPPQIFVSARAASLVVFDGEPVHGAHDGHIADVRREHQLGRVLRRAPARWYLLNNGEWLTAPVVEGPWAPAGALPAAFAALPAMPTSPRCKQADTGTRR